MAKENKVTNLNVARINKEVKRLDDVKVETITVNGVDYDLKVNLHFKNTKKQEVFEELVAFIDIANGIPDEKESADFLAQSEIYLLVLLIDKFTSLDVPKELAKRIAFANNLIDLDLMVPVVDAMPLEEVEAMSKFCTDKFAQLEENVTAEYEEFFKLAEKEIEQAKALEGIQDENLDEKMESFGEALKLSKKTVEENEAGDGDESQ